jgi:MinD superfamily P-loop ATPase
MINLIRSNSIPNLGDTLKFMVDGFNHTTEKVGATVVVTSINAEDEEFSTTVSEQIGLHKSWYFDFNTWHQGLVVAEPRSLNNHQTKIISKMYNAQYTPAPVQINLSSSEANKIAIQRICDVYGWDPAWKIEHEQVIKTVDAHTTHSFQYDEKVRKATLEDYNTYDIVSKLKASI